MNSLTASFSPVSLFSWVPADASQAGVREIVPIEQRKATAAERIFVSSAYSGGRDTLVPALGLSEGIRRRLFDLLKYAIEDGETLPDVQSVAALEKFVEKFPKAETPLIALNDDGLLIATWRKGQQSMLSIKFDKNNKIHYAWTLEDNRKVIRDWGETDSVGFLKNFAYQKLFLGGES